MTKPELLHALNLLQRGKFTPGPDMDAAHTICQSHEGRTAYDWTHALIHRIEGDDWNADYWYQRAGRRRFSGSVREEWQAIRDTI